MSTPKTEAWLCGPVAGVPALLNPAAHGSCASERAVSSRLALGVSGEARLRRELLHGLTRKVFTAAGVSALALSLAPSRAAFATPEGGDQVADTSVAQPTSTTLTRVSEIRRVDSSAVGRHVSITGVVTFFDPTWSLLFVQDSEEGIFVFMNSLTFATSASTIRVPFSSTTIVDPFTVTS